MKVSEIYEKYKIMPQLGLHMLRVAGVSEIICDNLKMQVDKKSVLSTCLLHDLGNMAKIKLDRFPEFAEPKGLDYWNKVLTKFKQKYGNDDYTATYTILSELHIPKNTYNLIQSLEFAKSPQTAKGKSYEQKICLYSDARVSPNGVVSVEKRLNEVKDRFTKRRGISEKKFIQISKSIYSIEKQIFKYCKISPDGITETNTERRFHNYLNYEI